MPGLVEGPDGLMHMPPALPVTAVKSYTAASRSRPASCEDVDCGAYLNGWQTTVDESTDLGQQQAHYMRHDRSRRHTEERQPDGLTAFIFGPGQVCFAASQHRLPAEGAERWIVRGGDWRGNPRGEHREHTRAEFWVEDFAEHQQRLADRLKEG